jgi:transcriptional regulator with XRE-family HTH domain
MVEPVVTGPLEGQQRSRPLLRTMLGDVLRRTRLEQGRTLADVARSARVSMPYLSEVERGRKEASSEVLAAICDALRIELADLVATTGRDLVDDSNRRTRVVRLEAIRAARVLMDRADQADPSGRAAAGRSGDAVCLLAA